MTRVNWNNFEAKFPDNEQSFEWFCYLLFCREFNKTKGISGYINQTGIEKDPIKNGIDVIGFQAKYYGESLTSYESKIEKSLADTHRVYPDLTKYYFYSNKTFGQRSKAKSKLENYAQNLGIEIVWKISDYFESEEVCINNEDLAEYFFTLDNSSLDNLIKLKNHTTSLLSNINYSIKKGENVIHIDHSKEINLIQTSKSKVFIIHGEGGCGKTALIKEYFEQNNNIFFCRKANELSECQSIEECLFNCSKDFFSKAFAKEPLKYFVIDSAEKVLDFKDNSIYFDFITFLADQQWTIIFTTRNSYFEILLSELFYSLNMKPFSICINPIETKELNHLLSQHHILLPTDPKLLSLIGNPFYLSYYVRFYSSETNNFNYLDFKKQVWNSFIKVEFDFVNLAKEKSNNGCFYLNSLGISQENINKMCNEKLITKEDDKYFISHDIFEEWALEKYIKNEFSLSTTYKDFLTKIGTSLPIRRAYRKWLAENLEEDNTITSQVFTYIQDNLDNFSSIRDTLISILLSNKAESFFSFFSDELLKDNFTKLIYIQNLLKIACKSIDEFWINSLTFENHLRYIEPFFTCPKGSGWNAFINFINTNISTIQISNLNLFFPIFIDWTYKYKKGHSTKIIASLTLTYFQWIQTQENHWHYSRYLKDIYLIISNGANELQTEIKSITNEILINNWRNHGDKYYDFILEILSDIKYANFWITFPDEVIKLMDLFWTYQEIPHQFPYTSYSTIDNDHDYGISSSFKQFTYPPSALQTPISVMLYNNYDKTIDFIISFLNKCTETYARKNPSEIQKICITINGEKKEQYINNELWCMFRGSVGNTPDLLQCILMALEAFFLDNAKHISNTDIEQKLLYILEKTNTCALTAVVCSIVLSNYKKLYTIARLLMVKDFVILDFIRCFHEQHAKMSYSLGQLGINSKYTNERLDTCKQKFRSKSLQDIILEYQVCQFENESEVLVETRRKEIWTILDNYYLELPTEEKQTQDDKYWRFRLASMDYRKMQWEPAVVDNKDIYTLIPNIPEDLQKYKEIQNEKINSSMPHMLLSNWIHDIFENNNKYMESDYSKNPTLAIQELKQLESQLKHNKSYQENDFSILNSSLLPRTAAGLIKCFSQQMTKEELDYCKMIVIKYSVQPLNEKYYFQYGDGVLECISVLPNLLQLELSSDEYEQIQVILLSIILLSSNAERNRKETLLISIRENFPELETNCLLEAYLLLIADWEKYLCSKRHLIYNNEISLFDIIFRFYDLHKEILDNYINNRFCSFSNINFDILPMHSIGNVTCMLSEKTSSHTEFIKNLFIRGYTLLDKNDYRDNFRDNIFFIDELTKKCFLFSDNEIEELLSPYIDNLLRQDFYEDLFNYFISAEDTIKNPKRFWFIWDLFYNKIVSVYLNFSHLNFKILKAYLFNGIPWKHNAKNWHTFDKSHSSFFYKISKELSIYEDLIDYISFLLYGIGSCYLTEGITWLSIIATSNERNLSGPFETYLLEQDIKSYIYKNQNEIRNNGPRKQEVCNILDYLIHRGSVTGYMLKDYIL